MSSRLVFFFPSLLALFLVAGLLRADEGVTLPPGVKKIAGSIRYHQRIKVRRPGETQHDYRLRLIGRGVDPATPLAEHCALYVESRLSVAEVARYAESGVVIRADRWVRPVGRHPHGFHLAIVPYDQLESLEADSRIVRLESLEYTMEPQNNNSRRAIRADEVNDGIGVVPLDGTGVLVAVADSGMDTSHPDLPAVGECYDMTVDPFGTDCANVVIGHGTYVTGALCASGGLSEGNVGNGCGAYQGIAPGIDLNFYKIAGDDGTAFGFDVEEAVLQALDVGCQVFNYSYAGTSDYMDGSSPLCGTIDMASEDGMVTFCAAGNRANQGRHMSVLVAPGEISDVFTFTSDGSDVQMIRVIWIDGVPGDLNLELLDDDLPPGATLELEDEGASVFGTESRTYALTPDPDAVGPVTYEFTLENTAPLVGDTPLVHCYRTNLGSAGGTFDDPDESYTVSHPAIADTAIAVGSWVSRKSWLDSENVVRYGTRVVLGTRVAASGIGPRIDMDDPLDPDYIQKPNILAPGTRIITTSDSEFDEDDAAHLVDNDGIDIVDGPYDYIVTGGTSLASAKAAGVAALLLQANPSLTPDEILDALTTTASLADEPDNENGYGLIDAREALEAISRDSDGDLEDDVVVVPFTFDFPDGRPSVLAPGGDTSFTLTLTPEEGSPDDDSAVLHYSTDNGETFETLTLVATVENEIDVEIPVTAADCLTEVQYFLTVMDDPESGDAHEYRIPGRGIYRASVAQGATVLLDEDFEAEGDWLVDPDGDDTATSGDWELVEPLGTMAQPGADNTEGDGSFCWVTANAEVGDAPFIEDVDLGYTTLESPFLDLSGSNRVFVSFWYTFFSRFEGNALIVEITGDDSDTPTWKTVAELDESTCGWTQFRFDVAEFIQPTSTVRLRFIASERTGGLLEAALDDLRVEDLDCVLFRRGDANGNGTVTGLGDGLFLLFWQFVEYSPAPMCMDAADANDSGGASGLSDGLFLLFWQFLPDDNDAPPLPGPDDCGLDPTADDPTDLEFDLGCETTSDDCL